MVRRSLQGEGRAARHAELSLGRSRPGFRVRHGRARSRLAELGRLLQRPQEIEGGGQCRSHRSTRGIVREAHGLVGNAWLLDHRGLHAQGRRRFAHSLADQRRQPEDRSRPRRAADPARGMGVGYRPGGQRSLQEGSADRIPGSVEIRLRRSADRRMDRDLERRLSRAAGRGRRRQDGEGGARRRGSEGDEGPARTPARSDRIAHGPEAGRRAPRPSPSQNDIRCNAYRRAGQSHPGEEVAAAAA